MTDRIKPRFNLKLSLILSRPNACCVCVDRRFCGEAKRLRERGDLCGITSFFNPGGFPGKVDLFRAFYRRVSLGQGLHLTARASYTVHTHVCVYITLDSMGALLTEVVHAARAFFLFPCRLCGMID